MIKYLLLSILAMSQLASAVEDRSLINHSQLNRSCCPPSFNPNVCHIGVAGFSTMDSENWYQILTFPYPTSTTLSINRNQGSTEGNIQLNSSGITINQPGNYSVSLSAILTFNEDPSYTPLIPLFLVRNGIFNPTENNVGGVGSVPFQQITTIQATGVLQNVAAGTTLSLIATNGGSPEPEPITVIGWGISVFRIPCSP